MDGWMGKGKMGVRGLNRKENGLNLGKRVFVFKKKN